MYELNNLYVRHIYGELRIEMIPSVHRKREMRSPSVAVAFFCSLFLVHNRFLRFIFKEDTKMPGKYVLALDQGTTSSRAIVFDKHGSIIAKAQNEFDQIYPKAGWVEHDPLKILYSQITSITSILNSGEVDAKDIAGIGITNQRETTILWDRATGKPVHNAIVWQCRRTAEMCEKIKEDKELCDYITAHTGLIIDAYFSATKIKWIIDNVPGVKALAEAGQLLFGTVETWLIWNLTGGHC